MDFVCVPSLIDLLYNLNKYVQCKHIGKFFKWEVLHCLHVQTVIVLYRLNRNEKLLEIFAYPSNNRVFYGPELNL